MLRYLIRDWSDIGRCSWNGMIRWKEKRRYDTSLTSKVLYCSGSEYSKGKEINASLNAANIEQRRQELKMYN
jgi:hypothetical protein